MLIAICDDDDVYVKFIEKYIAAHYRNMFSLVPFVSAIAMMLDFESGVIDPDICLLDINMDQNGIDIAKRIIQISPRCQIIFITNYLEYAPNVYDAEHVYFILKSEFEYRISLAIEKAVRRIEAHSHHKVVLAMGKHQRVICQSDILYIELCKHKTRVVCSTDEFLTYQRPIAIFDGNRIPFVQCHRSYFVNPSWVESIEKSLITLRNGAAIPMSRTYAGRAMRELTQAVLRMNIT